MMEDSELRSASDPTLLFIVNDVPYFLAHWGYRSSQAAHAGYQVHVAAPAHARSWEVQGEFHAITMDRKSVRPNREAKSLSDIVDVVRRVRPSIVHAITAKPNLYGGLTARRIGVPAVLSVTGLGTVFSSTGIAARLAQYGILRAYRIAAGWNGARVLFENPDDRALFLSAGVAPASRLTVIPGAGVDIQRFAPSPEVKSTTPIVMLATRMLREKGVEDFVIAARELSSAGISARFVLVGTPDAGNPSSMAASTLEQWVAAGDIEWWGHQTDMPSTLQAASLVCLPSYYREGIPRILIEAAACGRAIVATDVPGCREICRHGVNGVLVPARDPMALSSAIGRLLADSQLRQAMGARGREIVLREYRQEIVMERTLEVYCALQRAHR